ncbi:hypothetical protein VNO78_08325 [Psophocarpus tetragonolobus]|uniref:MIP18 family-like domain-containing protein n=1 Tax=Psophocarpus tetragonolobus TaxID=3891 RepID=A0AAN9SVW4_PSOTE
MTLGLINANPVVRAKKERIARSEDPHAVDPLDIYDILFSLFFIFLSAPSLLISLTSLCQISCGILGIPNILIPWNSSVSSPRNQSPITFTPTVQHCSMATVIGLCLRVKLKHYFPPHYKVDIKVSPGSHADEESVNKQLNDKERVAAALENPNLRQLVDECLYSNEL